MDEVIQKDEAGGRKGERDEKERAAIIERRLKLVEDPQSVVIAPKTREGHVLVRLVFGLDRAVSRIRLRAGTYVNIQDAVVCLKKVEGFIGEFTNLVNSFGGGEGGGDGRTPSGFSYENFETKRMLAQMRNAHIIIPRTNEARGVVFLIKRFDPALLQFRNACTDFAKSEQLFRKLIETIRDFNVLVGELFSLLNIPYEQPRDIKPLLASISQGGIGSNPEAQSHETQEVREEGVSSKKGRKSGGIF